MMFRNLRYALRILRKNPGFAVAAILTMALGIGASVTMFGALHAVVLRPLPYRQPDRIVQIWETKQQLKSDRITVAFPNYENWRDESHAFAGMAFVTGATYKLMGRGEPKKIQALSVSGSFFGLLGVAPRIGRVFQPQDEKSNNVAILSDTLWKSQFEGDPRIIGQSIELNGQAYAIVGVMPPDFYYPDFGRKWELWTPFAISAGAAPNRDAHFGGAVARLRTGATIEQAQADLGAIADRLAREFPSTNAGAGVRLVPIQEQAVGNVRRTLWAMFGAVGLLLLIACSNVASLLMVRAAARRKEIGVRIALGATSRDLISQLMTESLVLAGLGGLLGALLAGALLPLLRSIPVALPRIEQASIDPAVLLFSLAATVVSGALFGLMPALQLAAQDSNDTLKVQRSSRTVRSLVVAQIALAFVLLTGAGLLIESLARVLGVAPGFRAENVLTARVSLSQPARALAIEQRLLDELRTLPDVTAAGLTSNLPIGGTGWTTYFSIEGHASSRGDVLPSDARTISAGYLDAMGIPLVSGRIFDNADSPAAPLVAVVNELFARRYFPGENPIGHRVKFGRADDAAFPWLFRIVGVVGSVRHRTLEAPTSPELYLCASQMAGPLAILAPTDFSLAVRSRGDFKPLTGAVRAMVSTLDRNAPVSDLRPMEEVLSRSLAPRKFNLTIFAAFAAFALLLTWIGIYGVIAYSTALRTREIGIRMALGSDRPAIVRLVLAQGMRLAAAGIALGAAASWFASRLISSMLYGVSPHSPLILVGVAATLAGAAFLAGCIPARRAATVDPVAALRCE